MTSLENIVSHLPALFGALLLAILFVQSGLDKVMDWKGNLEFLTGHFSETIFRSTVPPMMATITILELLTGVLATAGVIYFLVSGSATLIFWAAVSGAAAITALFFGQRVAKDYPGAAVLVPYFLLILALMVLAAPR